MSAFRLNVKCPKCGIETMQESISLGNAEVICNNCDPPYKFTVNVNEANWYIDEGYWRGVCSGCNRLVASSLLRKRDKQYYYCGECSKIYEVEKGDKIEERDATGKTAFYDKEKERKRMVIGK